MNSLSVIPHIGIGPLKLGMSPDQILSAINQIAAELDLLTDQKIFISKDKEDNGYSLRYLGHSFFFLVQYRNEQAVEIAVDYSLREKVNITLYNIDVFHTPAEELVNFLKQYSPCSYDLKDEQLSTNYEFSAIGIRLWREEPFHQKLLSDPSYMKSMALVIDEIYHYNFFELIAVRP